MRVWPRAIDGNASKSGAAELRKDLRSIVNRLRIAVGGRTRAVATRLSSEYTQHFVLNHLKGFAAKFKRRIAVRSAGTALESR